MKEKFLMVIAGCIALPQIVWESAWGWFNGVEPETDPIHQNAEEPSNEEFQ